MNLVIDIGNTRTKMALFTGRELSFQTAEPTNEKKKLLSFPEQKVEFTKCIISSVSHIPKWLLRKIKKSGINPLILDHKTRLPFRNSYHSKESLGYDRIAAIAGACQLFPGKNVLVIDAGTAITYDLKTDHEEYLGGTISPGLSMRFRALHEYTSRLPLIEPETHAGILGLNTGEAIIYGVQNGFAFEMES